MRRQHLAGQFLMLTILAAVAAPARSASPRLSIIIPRGVQRGAEHVLTFSGSNLGDAKEVFFYEPAGFEVTKVEPSGNSCKVTLKVAADCRRFEEMGCAGVDLLAYRATEADPIDLVKAARDALQGQLVVAGSIDSPARIHSLAEAGVDAFTIGSAVFNGAFSPRKAATVSQLADVLAACG